jgi:hypothetical protein
MGTNSLNLGHPGAFRGGFFTRSFRSDKRGWAQGLVCKRSYKTGDKRADMIQAGAGLTQIRI